jgi:Lantibiotic dehydratase, N terminus
MSMGATEDNSQPANHHPGLGDTWSWWPQVLVRSAGFPGDGVLELAAPEVARRAGLVAAEDTSAEAWREFRAEYEAAATVLGSKIQKIAASERFRLAFTWQNHHAAEQVVSSLLRWRPGVDLRHSKHRQREDLIASYWQRYCVKNDTIGFFGPVGWGRLTGGDATRFAPGKELIASSDVFFEPWAIDRVAEALQAEPGMEEWLAPRRVPFIRLDQDSVLPPAGPSIRLSPLEIRVLNKCDGLTCARDIARELTGCDADGDPDSVFTILRRFESKRWITWKLDLPITPWPEAPLRQALNRVPDNDLRQRALARLDALESGRADVVACGPDPDALGAALKSLDGTFAAITGAAPTRHQGRAYGGRTLLYEDCQRDIDLQFGDDIVRAAAPVELLLNSARWFCWSLGEALRSRLREVYRQAAGQDGQLDLASFWFASMRLLGPGIATILSGIDAEMTRRWELVLGLHDSNAADQSRAYYTYADVAPKVRAAFDAPHAGWSGARYMSPDIILAARDIADLQAGDFELVLGELHMAINTQRNYCFVTQHPSPDDLMQNVDRDFPAPRLIPVLPKESLPRLSIRTHQALIREVDFMVAHAYNTVPAERQNLLASRDVEVTELAGQLLVRLPNKATFDLLDAFSEILMNAVIDRFRVLGDKSHAPRVTIDKVVISREEWRFDPTDVAFAYAKDEPVRFVQAQAWRRLCRLPRHVFAQPAGKAKPMYFDFDSPPYVNLLARMIRRAARSGLTVTVAEMLPGFERLWLTDQDGSRYTSELRMTSVDRLTSPDWSRTRDPVEARRR